MAIFYGSMYGDTENAANILACRLAEMGIQNATVYGRVKHPYSIYRKMYTQDKSMEESTTFLPSGCWWTRWRTATTCWA